ncbi:MAG: mechanosensitive ion channel family protein [Rhodospirillales bacterium]
MDDIDKVVTWVETAGTEAVGYVTAYGLSVIGGVILLVVGWSVAGWARRAVDRGLGRIERMDVTLRHFLASLVRYVILIFVVLAVLAQFGVQTASLIAIFGAAGLAVGLALQGTLSNLAAGVMLLLFRPFRVGQFVQAGGHAGTVRAIDLFVTELATPDNVQILIPNGQIWGAPISNFSFHDSRRVEFRIGIDYRDDIDTAFGVLAEVIAGDSRCLAEPKPQIVVDDLTDSAVAIVVRVWTAAGDFWPVKFDLTRAFKQALDAAGITIPFPQRTVHVIGRAAAE